MNNAARGPRISAQAVYRGGMARISRIAKRTGLWVLAVAIGVTGCSAVYNTVTSPGTKPARQLAPSGRFVEAGGVLTHYERFGSTGSPIVLVGGFLEPSDTWDGVARLLAKHHRVLAMDLAGFGYSQRSGKYRLGDWQRQLDAFMRALGIRRALLVGHSLGAGVIAAQALAHPGRTSGIVLVDGDALASGGGPGFLRDLIVDPYRTSVFRIVRGWDWAMRGSSARPTRPIRCTSTPRARPLAPPARGRRHRGRARRR